MKAADNLIYILVECKKIKSESMILARVCGFDWKHWIASPAEGLSISTAADIVGDWLMSAHVGPLEEKIRILNDAFLESKNLQLEDASSSLDTLEKGDHFFAEVSLFSMDGFKTGFSIAIERFKVQRR